MNRQISVLMEFTIWGEETDDKWYISNLNKVKTMSKQWCDGKEREVRTQKECWWAQWGMEVGRAIILASLGGEPGQENLLLEV